MKAHRQSGFTLIGVLFATIIIVVLTTAAIRTVIRSEQVVDLVRERFVAVNLAREGIELVRAVRDTNWLNPEGSGSWIDGGICQQNGEVLTDNDRAVFVDLDIVRVNHEVDINQNSTLFQSSIGRWTHNESSGEATKYSREISIDCSEAEGESEFISISAKVFWESRGELREVVVRDQLSNWIFEEGFL